MALKTITTTRTITERPLLKIRAAMRDDMGTIADFVRSSAEWYRPIVDEKDMAEHEVDAAWADENFKKRDFYVGFTEEGEAVGTISLQYFGDYAYLGYIYLDVKHVGKGFGQTLMSFAEKTARAAGMCGMALIAHPEAKWASKAYLKYGFEIVETDKDAVLDWNDGVLRHYYEEDFELYLYDLSQSE